MTVWVRDVWNNTDVSGGSPESIVRRLWGSRAEIRRSDAGGFAILDVMVPGEGGGMVQVGRLMADKAVIDLGADKGRARTFAAPAVAEDWWSIGMEDAEACKVRMVEELPEPEPVMCR